MNENKGAGVTWFTAYKILSKGKSPAIGRYPGWKSSIVNIAVVAPIAVAFVGGSQIRMMSGAIPPEAPLIKATGSFVQVTHGQASYIAFDADDGHIYNMERGTTIRDNKNMPQEIPPPKVYVEGFLRGNGSGYFWPVLIKTQGGSVLLSAEQSMLDYKRKKDRVYGVTVFYVILNIILFFFSFRFISDTKRRLMLGE